MVALAVPCVAQGRPTSRHMNALPAWWSVMLLGTGGWTYPGVFLNMGWLRLLEHGLVPAPPRQEVPAEQAYPLEIPPGSTVWTDGSGQFSADPACSFRLVTDQAGNAKRFC